MKEALTSDYDFNLPEHLIAQRPLANRDDSRMLIVRRKEGTIEHGRFRDFEGFLQPKDLVVLNNSRVIPARTFSDDGKIEVFFLERLAPRTWLGFVKPGKKMRLGATCRIGGVRAVVIEVKETGERVLELDEEPDLQRIGHVPLPPYIKRDADGADEERYQNVFACQPGSVASATAGLHFTESLLAQIPHEFLTLHVGPGTFMPVKIERLSEHPMHEESYEISATAAERINAAKRVIAIGTTTTRVLESQPPGPLSARNGRTRIFIYPPYQFQHVDALLTNFHLPRSTLLMLVSAFGGYELIREAYRQAVENEYRFYSYGDCMLMI